MFEVNSFMIFYLIDASVAVEFYKPKAALREVIEGHKVALHERAAD